MLTQTYYLVRSRADGQYLVARLSQPTPDVVDPGYVLLFREHFEALTYLNTHGRDIADRFAVESIPGTQVESLMKRWNFTGIGVVEDPIPPKVAFLAR